MRQKISQYRVNNFRIESENQFYRTDRICPKPIKGSSMLSISIDRV